MKFSIIIPTYNQAAYLEACLDSVWRQSGTIEKELIVIDGDSGDDTRRILEENSHRIAFWTSEPDRGQTHAINKGLQRMTGDWWMYLNSDDLLEPGALERVARACAAENVFWIAGSALVRQDGKDDWVLAPGPVDTTSDLVRPWSRSSRFVFPFSGSSYMHRRVVEVLGPFDEKLHFSMDIEFFVRAWLRGGFHPCVIPEILAVWHRHPASKTEREGVAWGFREDEITIAERYQRSFPAEERAELRGELSFERKMLTCRKALVFRGSQGLFILVKGVLRQPGLLLFRPWWGALRRLLFPVKLS